MGTAPNKHFLTNIGSANGDLMWSERRVAPEDVEYTKNSIIAAREEAKDEALFLMAETIATMNTELNKYKFLSGNIGVVLPSKNAATIKKGCYLSLRFLRQSPDLAIQYKKLCNEMDVKA